MRRPFHESFSFTSAPHDAHFLMKELPEWLQKEASVQRQMRLSQPPSTSEEARKQCEMVALCSANASVPTIVNTLR